jgi:hypothetical protein
MQTGPPQLVQDGLFTSNIPSNASKSPQRSASSPVPLLEYNKAVMVHCDRLPAKKKKRASSVGASSPKKPLPAQKTPAPTRTRCIITPFAITPHRRPKKQRRLFPPVTIPKHLEVSAPPPSHQLAPHSRRRRRQVKRSAPMPSSPSSSAPTSGAGPVGGSP